MTTKFFISYRSTDSKKVDPIVARLRSLKYEVWQDKDSIPVGQDWWEAICEGILNCEVFLFMVSRESVKSSACLAELSFAHQLNLPVIPFVLEGEWVYNDGGKYTIDFWSDIPAELQDEDNRAQFLFYEGVTFVDALKRGIAKIMAKKLPRFAADPPPDPRHATDTSNNVTVIYDEACDFAMRGEFTTAEKLFRKLINRNDPTFGAFSHEWVNLLREYVRIHDMAQRRNTRKIAQGQWLNYTQQFPKAFVDDIFDPKNVTQLFVAESTSPVIPVSPPPAAVQPKPAPVSPPPPAPKPAKPRSANVLPAPFAWVDIPAGKVSLVNTWDDDSKVYLKKDKPQTFDVAAFKLAKYPLTNAQFKLFVDAGGYREKRWWTAAGWEAKLKGWAWKGSEYMETNQPWTEPRYWQDAKWNTPDQPVVGVSWYESVAFCQWLSEQTGEKIMLPTEQQWQFAAQGQEGRVYPWGKDWDGTRCNNSVKPQDSNVTTPVRQFEGKGDSPFGIVDMAGNVWEWCLTDYEQGTQDINSNATYRVLRGGSWINYSSDYFRCVFRLRNDPHNGGDDRGLRLALS